MDGPDFPNFDDAKAQTLGTLPVIQVTRELVRQQCGRG